MIGDQSVLGLITARGGSKGIPGKNGVIVGGRPLIQWTIDEARRSAYVDRLVLSTDDPHLMMLAAQAGCEVPFRRDAALATDAASSIDVVIDALSRVPNYDLVVLLQPTSPLRRAEDIDAALQLLHSSGAPACVSVRAAVDHPYWTFRLKDSRELVHFVEPDVLPLRRQELPAAWCLNGAVYAARAEWLRAEKSFLSPRTLGYCMPEERSLDIDTPEDLERFRAIVEASRHQHGSSA